jgi:(p)ppGpp synthase/HD superfamily hydrolase
MPTIEQTIEFIRSAHAGQTDKGGQPYWQHPVAVMRRLGPAASENEKMAALLHDVIEDTGTTAEDLRGLGYPEEVIEAVSLLSRPHGVAYLNWIRSIAASGNQTAIRVKIADNEENSDPARVAAFPAADRGLVNRYHRSLSILRRVVPGSGDASRNS